MAEPAVDHALVLAGPLTADTAGDAHARMLARLADAAAPPAIAIHAGEVTQLDAAGAQLLYAFVAEVARRGRSAEWTAASVYLVEAARMLGMESCLGLAGLPPEVTSWQP